MGVDYYDTASTACARLESFFGQTQLSTAKKAARAGEEKEERREDAGERGQAWSQRTGADAMSKGMDQKKEGKKKPAKSLEEKRAAKKAKKADRAFMQRT